MSGSPDVIVVGAGTAGAVVAGRLAEAGASVLMLEAGADHGPSGSGRWPADLLDAAGISGGHDWGYAGPGAGLQELSFGRARVIGGCSSHNGCAQTVGWAGDYDAMAEALGAPQWSASALRPLFEHVAGRMRIRRYADNEVQPFQRAFLSAASATGTRVTDDLDELDGGAGAGIEPVNIVDGTRWNTAFGYIDPVRESGRLELRCDAHVERLALDGGRVTGVRATVDGRSEVLRAGAVVVSAGTYGSPEVLLRSGIGPGRELAALGIEVVHDLPGVGRNLHDQPAVHLEFAATHELAEQLAAFTREHWLPAEQAIAKISAGHTDGPYDLHVYPWIDPDPEQDTGWRCVIPAALLTPRSRGILRLGGADPALRPRIDHGFLSDPDGADLEALAAGVEWIERVITERPLAGCLGEALVAPPAPGDPSTLRTWIRGTHRHYWHPAGTCRMGPPGDAGAVVDAEGRVHGLENLTVADASVLPRIPRSTPAWPVAVVGELIAAALIGRGRRIEVSA